MKIKLKLINNAGLFLLAMLLLNAATIQAQEEIQEKADSLKMVNVAFGKVAQDDLIGAVSTVNIPELLQKNYYTGSLDGLQSFVGGYNGNIWGQTPLVLIDGIPLSSGAVDPTQIESITILKGAGAVALYGSRAAKGAVLITTKRGEVKPLTVDIRANTGIYIPKRYPLYLNAAEYMSLYNEACLNDGITQRYEQATIYNTATGTNPYRYPDLNLYTSDYLRSAYNKTDATLEVSGGSQRTRYYSNFGMRYNNGLLKYGEQKNNNDQRFNVRANVDIDITDWLKASTDASVIFIDNYRGNGNFWGTASTLRPNLFSYLIPIDMLDHSNNSNESLLEASRQTGNGQYLFGGISTNQTNALADMLAGGYTKEKTRYFLFNVNLDADLGMLVKGLSFKTGYSVDYGSYYTESWADQYAVYEPTWANMNGDDLIISLTKYGVDKPSTQENVGSSTFTQTMSFRAFFDYKRTFADNHNVSGLLGGWGFQIQNAQDSDYDSDNDGKADGGSAYHRTSNVNLGLQLAYNFRHRYYFDFSSALAHSAKLPEGNRDAFSPAVTLGWRISDESFFKDNVSFVDNLKLTASYANLNQDLDITNYYMYSSDYKIQGIWYRRDIQSNGIWYPFSLRGENTALGFIKRKEFRAGLELSLLNRLVSLDANYFLQNTKGLLADGSNTIFPSYYKYTIGSEVTSFLPNINNNEDKRSGVDFTLNLNKKIGRVDASLGFSGMYYTSEAVVRDEVYADDYQYRAGRPLDSYWGYVCEGFFQTDEEIANHATQTFGEVKKGDLKYKDVNNDGTIDSRDQVDLGHNGWSVSPFTYGLHLTLKWNNFTLFAMGTGNTGAIGFKNTDYYWVRGARKYSEAVWGRWTEETKNTATYPRLTTTEGANNFRNSTFWMYKTDRFDLTKVQLTYDFPKQIFANLFIKDLSVYVSGESLFTFSKESKMMETNVGSAPANRFFNFGLKTHF